MKDIEELTSLNLLDRVKDVINNEELGRYSKMVDLLMEDGFTSFDIAAALLKFYMDKNSTDRHQELDMVDFSKNTTRLYINIGKKKGVRARHILAALVQDGGLSSKSIGDIDIYDKFTFVDVPSDLAASVISNLTNKRIKGSRVKAEISNPKRN